MKINFLSNVITSFIWDTIGSLIVEFSSIYHNHLIKCVLKRVKFYLVSTLHQCIQTSMYIALYLFLSKYTHESIRYIDTALGNYIWDIPISSILFDALISKQVILEQTHYKIHK